MSHEIPSARLELVHNEERLDLSEQVWTDRLAEASIYVKTVLVDIHRVRPGTEITTTLADGRVETKNVAGLNHVVITNPGGEQQIVSTGKAMQRYDPTEIPGVFRAKGMVRAIDNPTGRPIVIQAPWGELQYGDERCKIVSLVSPSHPHVIDEDRYIIGGDEFTNTYELLLEKISMSRTLSREFDVTAERTEEDFIPLGEIGLFLADVKFDAYV